MREKEKPKDFKKTVRRLLGFFKGSRHMLVLIFFLVLGSSAAALVTPMLIGNAVDALDRNAEVSVYATLIAMMLAIYFGDAVMRFLQQFVVAGTSQRLVMTLRKSVFGHLQKLPVKFFDGYQHGELMSRLSNDTDNIAGVLGTALVSLSSIAIVLTGVLIMMLRLSPVMTFFSLVSIPLFFLVNRTITKQTRKYFKQQQETLGRLNAKAEEDITGMAVIKAYNHEGHAIREFDEINDGLRAVSTKAQIWSGFIMPIMNVINNLSLAVVALAGGILALDGRFGLISVGMIATFISYSRQFGRPLNELASTYNAFLSALASCERVFGILDESEETPDPANAQVLKKPRGHIIFDKMSFSYNPNEFMTLSDISFEVEPGSTVAFVGPTGAGKTTIVNLITRFYDPLGGSITLDGTPLFNFTRDSLRRAFGVVLQDAYLFTGTVYDNIRYGKPDAKSDEVYQAAKYAGAHHFISQLPDGYESVLTENSHELSTGQRQLLAIARCVLADPAILILDEATSNVDTRTEIRIQHAMARLMKGRTCFVIAHRLRTIANADQILFIDGGRVTERGNHAELMKIGGAYYRMFTLQSEGIAAD
ncbi:MAG: ABC transporter ATP-binding protein/permease [Defluviitaleaceae bacterium]|nr:ABC transporter ATP-binding protein/permease [Defluviitaleaceae bacterium]